MPDDHRVGCACEECMPLDMDDAELPGMWESADLSGGWADVSPDRP